MKAKVKSRINVRFFPRRKGSDSAVQFFYEHAGYSYDPKTETPDKGRLRGAQALAQAEEYAAAKDWGYSWDYDRAGCIGCDCDSADCACSTGEPHETLVCFLRTYDGEVLEALGGICGATPEYSRVVEAELALQAMPMAETQSGGGHDET
jgi:hypothetical protein